MGWGGGGGEYKVVSQNCCKHRSVLRGFFVVVVVFLLLLFVFLFVFGFVVLAHNIVLLFLFCFVFSCCFLPFFERDRMEKETRFYLRVVFLSACSSLSPLSPPPPLSLSLSLARSPDTDVTDSMALFALSSSQQGSNIAHGAGFFWRVYCVIRRDSF